MTLSAGNPIRAAMMSILVFDIVVFWLAFAGMVQLSKVPVGTAVLWTTAATVLALLGAVGLRRGWGYWFGWATQGAGIALGLLTPWMYAMGIVFALIWIMSFVLGKRLDRRSAVDQA
ncbi:DUF4233 domain-containing protein [Tessaracoccus sp. OS52]|uniref:DUF4233 domain-containing protein n=1 Tax=Tessaracoccus sp. OS52 TaxID=2886691 RepID=UPI001D0FA01B|nr:DUF4233 domain-containing protein [Tessaracoccus sp. OS52]MCC2592586.1 DUF4233 domain-containing protein [Tessaracoccus sp. OS52]